MTRKLPPLSIEVCAHWQGLERPQVMGTLSAIPGRGDEIFAFECEPDWLQSSSAQILDPSLNLYAGPQYAPDGQVNFGIFLDSAPDRWGRLLMKRREQQRARAQGRSPRVLRESDYLLGVHDAHRLGALRFRRDPQGPFLDDNTALASPPWTSLRELEHASLELEKEGSESHPDYNKWLNLLIAPGASLGGARPKASVVDERAKGRRR